MIRRGPGSPRSAPRAVLSGDGRALWIAGRPDAGRWRATRPTCAGPRCGRNAVERSPHPLTSSVMEELRRLLDAAAAFETGVAQHYGLDREDMTWFVALGTAEHGMAAPEIAVAADRPLTHVEDALRRLRELGHVTRVAGAEDRVTLTSAARALLVDAYAPVEAAYVGLYRYDAAELRVVRTFLRIGREFYERQVDRVERHKARLTSTVDPPAG